MPRSHGTRRKARSILTRDNVVRGISYLLHDHKVGDKVIIDIDPREHDTMPHRRFHGRIGVVKEVRKRTLKIAVMFGDKEKIIQPRFNHIRAMAAQGTRAKATQDAKTRAAQGAKA